MDKCRASVAGKQGEYHYDCPLDNQLFGFKGINGDQFKSTVASAKAYEDVAVWLQSHGLPKTLEEIKKWSDQVEAAKLKDVFANHSQTETREVIEMCRKMGIDYETATLFEWLEADDQASFEPHSQVTAK